MNNRIELKRSRAVRLAASAVAAATAVAGAAGIAATQAYAAQPVRAHLRHDVLAIEGTKASDTIALRLEAGVPGVLQVDVGDDGAPDFSFALTRIAAIAVNAGASDDLVRVDESNGAVNANIPTAIAGGDGDDEVAGGSGAETLLGGNGNDSIDGNRGNDVAFMGAGNDTFVWDQGDGSDVVEGQDGADTMVFNGAAFAEKIDLSTSGSRLKLVRDIGNITMDTAGVERVGVNTAGAADLITVNDLTGTSVFDVNVDLAGTLGGATGDGQQDRVVVNGTNGRDTISVSGDASGIAVSGLPALVAIQHQEATDELAVNGLGGNDLIAAGSLDAQAIALTLDGGAGEDNLRGGQGIEALRGGGDTDSIDGNGGNDVAFMGAGDDTFVWDPGDGSDVVEGQDGADTMLFNGAGGAEQMDLSANGNRLTFFRTQGNITMDTASVERVDVTALGGADVVTVNDLSGTGVSFVNVDLAGTVGGDAGDGQADRVVVNGTDGNDAIDVSGDTDGLKVSGLAATVGILHGEAANDRLEINTLAGTDGVETIGLAAGAIQLFVDGALVDLETVGRRNRG